MKNLFKIVLLGFLTLSISPVSFADAGASAKNKCKNGKRYKSKAKVNGPNSCKREKYVDINCQYASSEAKLNRKSETNCTCIGYEWTPGGVLGSHAKGYASSSQVYSSSWKTGACSGYKAGGAVMFDRNQSPRFEGDVKSEIGFSEMTFDYVANSISLSRFNSLLEINSEDFANEYSILQVSVDIVTEDANGDDVLSNIFFSQATFKDGRLVLLGDFFKLDDFIYKPLAHGCKYELNLDQKLINLNTDIEESMVIEVTINTDAGNILDGDSEIEKSSVTLDASVNAINNNLLVKINSAENLLANLDIRDMNGVKVHEINSIDLASGREKILDIDKSVLMDRGPYFVIILRLSNGQVVVDNIILY
jgi:hypothetical protein